MPLEVIYVTRHGFRSNWLVDPTTGDYSTSIKSPTGIPADPALTAHGVDQARELAAHLLTVEPAIERIYSSPYYRCLQTVEPFVNLRNSKTPENGDPSAGQGRVGNGIPEICAETGLSEWYGSAPFEHPCSAPTATLKELFPSLDTSYRSVLTPSRMGETIDELHDRVAATMEGLVKQCDAEGIRAILLCSHAATIIALGRVLTGVMPQDVETEDFRAFTCGLSVFRRRGGRSESSPISPAEMSLAAGTEASTSQPVAREIRSQTQVDPPAPSMRETLPVVPLLTPTPDNGSASRVDQGRCRSNPSSPTWRDGRGVRGGWDCEVNSDCAFLSHGEERGWRFAGDESFKPPGRGNWSQVDAGIDLGVVVEGRPTDARYHEAGDSKL